ncbi:hypothetical protein GDO81_004296 [Engystomops pustulosus]|uniref:Uncharacterized protein n=1 Tax=Engystomops pustulosus TaxID=76066 RepID=A0AAV6ZWH4_ENGPU|nr:hypothetical protein GDO81_004296 [Engystomops pustulosus]
MAGVKGNKEKKPDQPTMIPEPICEVPDFLPDPVPTCEQPETEQVTPQPPAPVPVIPPPCVPEPTNNQEKTGCKK